MDGELWILVADEGCGHQTASANPGLGWGLALIAEACDDFILAERSAGGTEARMRFDVA
jgi:two-component sensor histidine kinase